MTNQGKPSYDMGMRIRVPTEVQNFNGRVAADLVPVPDWRFTLGADVVHTFRDATRYRTMVDMDMVNREKAWPGATITQAGVFAKARRTVGDLTLTGTTRLDLAQADVNDPTDAFRQNVGVGTDLQQNDAMLSGSVTASLPLSGRWALSLGAGSVARPADATERYAERFPSSKSQMSAEFLGTPSLDPERSTQADLWLDGRGSWWSLSVNGFARRIDDYITFEKTDIDPVLPMSPAVFRYTNGEATFVGSEVSAAAEPLRTVTLRASGSYLWGRDETLDEPAFGVAPPSGTLGLRWRPPVGVQPLSNVYLDGAVHWTAEQDRVAGTRGETATDGYTTVDLQVGAQVLRRVELTAGVENLFDVTYTNHLNAKNPFSGAQLPEPGRVVTTNLTVRF
jgi:iron complex outermembrane receptor protein